MTVSFEFWSVTFCHLAVTIEAKHHQRSGEPLIKIAHSLHACWLSFHTIFWSFDLFVFQHPPQKPNVFFKGSAAQLQWLGISFWLGRQPANRPTWDCCHHPGSWYCHFSRSKKAVLLVELTVLISQPFLLALHSTTEFFVFQQPFYWTRRFDQETRAFFGYTSKLSNMPIYTFVLLCLGVATYRAKIVLNKC